jgi:hypothetical protein
MRPGSSTITPGIAAGIAAPGTAAPPPPPPLPSQLQMNLITRRYRLALAVNKLQGEALELFWAQWRAKRPTDWLVDLSHSTLERVATLLTEAGRIWQPTVIGMHNMPIGLPWYDATVIVSDELPPMTAEDEPMPTGHCSHTPGLPDTAGFADDESQQRREALEDVLECRIPPNSAQVVPGIEAFMAPFACGESDFQQMVPQILALRTAIVDTPGGHVVQDMLPRILEERASTQAHWGTILRDRHCNGHLPSTMAERLNAMLALIAPLESIIASLRALSLEDEALARDLQTFEASGIAGIEVFGTRTNYDLNFTCIVCLSYNI